jgi:metal-responsive CopG/Arc/MetJ family transcriptional regulator
MWLKIVTVWLPDDLLQKIDQARGDVPRSRWIKRVLERALNEAG